ncbi:MAG: response regulator transcription factor [Wolinella sp.]
MKILLLEDDYNYKESIKDWLLSLEYDVDDFSYGEEALDAIFTKNYDLLLLDIRVPGIDGYEILREARKYGKNTPVIFITSLTDEVNLVHGYELGCSDYIRKPFSLKELKYRIQEAIRRYHFHTTALKIALAFEFSFEPSTEILWHKNVAIPLSEKERKLLILFIKNVDIFISIETIREYVWDGREIGDSDIRMMVKRLREKSHKELIISRRGMGYKIAKKS